MILGLAGKLSSGKTVTAVKFAYEEGKKGKKVISNIKLFFPKSIQTVIMSNEEILDFIKKNVDNPNKLADLFYNSVFLIDEVTNLFNARKSGSLINELMTGFIMMVGKLDCDIVMTYQLRSSMVDRRLREISTVYGNCYRYTENGKPVIFGGRILNKKIYIRLVLAVDLDLEGLRIVNQVFDPEFFYKLYDTREIVLLDRSKYGKLGKKSLYKDKT